MMGHLKRAAIGGVIIFGLALASCSTKRPPRVPGSTSQVGRAVSPPDYVAGAASIDLFVPRAGALAASRSDNARLRVLAGEMAEAHRGLAAQLSLAGRRVNALPGARLLPREEQRLAALEAGYSDSLFLREMREAHDQSLALHSAFAARGASATLRPVAANAVQVERSHLAELRSR